MAQRGRPPKPTEVKRRTGNPGKRALPAAAEVVPLDPAIGIPEPLRPLGKMGREFWDRTWEVGVGWISPKADIEIMMMTAEMIDERTILRNLVFQDRNGDRPKLRSGLRQLESHIQSNLAQLGLSPADRARLGLAEVKRQSKLAELKQMNT
jgi:hypothetical protein